MENVASPSKGLPDVGCVRQVPRTTLVDDVCSTEPFLPPENLSDSSDGEYDTDLEADPPESTLYNSQGRGAYLRACENLNVVPCSPFLRQLHLDTMHLKHYSLGPKGAEAVAVGLMRNSTVAALNIADNGIKPEGAIYISKMLTENFFISAVDISQNELSTQGAYAISEMLRENSELLELNVSGNKFTEKDAEPLVEAMKENYTLKSLDLSHNDFCETGGQLLGPAIDSNVGLEYLNLSWNNLRRKGAVAIGYGLRNNCALKSLDLSWNGFADDGAQAMGEALRGNTSLLDLDLSSNRISGEGAKHLASGILENTTLQVLRIGKNPFQSQGAYEILNAIHKNKESGIEELFFDDIPVNTEFEDLLEMILEERPSLLVQCGATMRGKDRMNKMKKKVDVLNMLLEYIELRGLRVVDFFRQIDKDNSKKITKAAFMAGVKKAGIPMTQRQLKKLVNILDADNDGTIDYSEMVAIKSDDVFDFYHKKIKKDDPTLKSYKMAKQQQLVGIKMELNTTL